MVKFPELYDLKVTDLNSSLLERAEISIRDAFPSPFFINSLAMEVDVAVKQFSEIQNQLPSDISELSFGDYGPFVIARSQKNGWLKEFAQIRICLHNWVECTEVENPSRCQSFHFTRNKVKVTTIEDLREEFGNIRIAPGKVLITFIEEISCHYPEWISHATVLVISREVDSFRAFYCDSNGFCMPTVLRIFLEETFTEMVNENYITEYCLEYSNIVQQRGNDACMLLTIFNASLISNGIIEGVSQDEIVRRLGYCPSRDCLREIAWRFFDNFSRAFCHNMVLGAKILDILIIKLLQTPLLNIFINQENQELKEMGNRSTKALNHLIDVFEKLSKTEGNIINDDSRKFFFEEIFLNSNFMNVLAEIPSLLKEAFYKYYDSLTIHFEQKKREVDCTECKSRIEARKNICLKKKECLVELYSHFSTFYNLTSEMGVSPLEHLVQVLKTEEETENSISNCSLCQSEIVTEKTIYFSRTCL